MISILELLEKYGGLHKFGGIAPEGFKLIHEKTLQDLKNFENWNSWVNGELDLMELDKKYFNED